MVDVVQLFPRNNISWVTDVTEESVGVGASVSVAPDQALSESSLYENGRTTYLLWDPQ